MAEKREITDLNQHSEPSVITDVTAQLLQPGLSKRTMGFIRDLLRAPNFGDPAKDRIAGLQHNIITAVFLAALGGVVINLLSWSGSLSGLGVMVPLIFLTALASYWQRRGHLERTSWVLVGAMLLVFLLALFLSGLTIPVVLILTLTISLAGLLLRFSRVIAVTVISLIVVGVAPHIVVKGTAIATNQLAYTLVILGLEGLLLVVAARAMERSFAEANRSTKNLSLANKELQDLTVNLEIRVADRTQVLARQALQLQTAAEVSRAASSELDADELTQTAVNLVRDRFELYYVGLFLLDEERRFAMLQAGTGDAGRQLLADGHKLEINSSSMIGACITQKQARLAQHAAQEAARFSNLLLPETRSELALPLISQGQVIGAMTVQSQQESAFSPEDISILQTLADQLANGIEKARLYKRVQQRAVELDQAREAAESARITAEEANRSLAAQMWQTAGQALLNERMRGEQDVPSLASNVIDQLCSYLDAQIGALYVLDQDLLKMVGSYAYKHRDDDGEFQLGEGPAGQAALTKKLIIVNVPEDYLPLASLTLEKVVPKHILYLPFTYDGRVIGVIELRKLVEFTAPQRRFLEETVESIAIAFMTAQARARVDELLAQTRQQAEELQAQEEELRATNEELEAQTESLRASQARVKKSDT